MPSLTARTESWPIRGVFRISRGERTEARVVVATVVDGDHAGRGECVPYPRYGESVEGVMAAIEAMRDAITEGTDRDTLRERMPAGAARNALDCALWDLEAKRRGTPVWRLAGLETPMPLTTAYTISLDEPEAMGRAAQEQANRPLLKLKLTGTDDLARVRAVRHAAPESRLIVDANEAWTPEVFAEMSPMLAALGVELIEQPLPADRDEPLANMPHPVPIAADESCHTSTDVPALAGRYDVVNVKLDKTGGLTEALRVVEIARDVGLGIMVGCMVGTSLGVAPATLLGPVARYVDLDAPLLLARDRTEGLRFEGSTLFPARRELWG
ncbi:MAG: mandelate racemase [Gemmatimonas sp. SG8_28]|jgi:L-alanine-DL-glutamate epimerase-like enolase superfamily enzyme|nr:MAG: mandelate racemase [Gemmatimonas sp. SG8_28]